MLITVLLNRRRSSVFFGVLVILTGLLFPHVPHAMIILSSSRFVQTLLATKRLPHSFISFASSLNVGTDGTVRRSVRRTAIWGKLTGQLAVFPQVSATA
jgi:hypothetical protein